MGNCCKLSPWKNAGVSSSRSLKLIPDNTKKLSIDIKKIALNYNHPAVNRWCIKPMECCEIHWIFFKNEKKVDFLVNSVVTKSDVKTVKKIFYYSYYLNFFLALKNYPTVPYSCIFTMCTLAKNWWNQWHSVIRHSKDKYMQTVTFGLILQYKILQGVLKNSRVLI